MSCSEAPALRRQGRWSAREGWIDGFDGAGLEVGVEVGLPEAQGAAGVGELDSAFGDEAVDEPWSAAQVVGGAVDVVESVARVRRGAGLRCGHARSFAHGLRQCWATG